jgi:MYXO-CTERM domain-containing protein
MKRLGLTALLLVSGLASAQNYLDYKMLASQQNPFPVYVDTRSNSPGGLDSTLMQNAVHRAWDTWNGVQCALPKVQWMGPTAGIVQNPPSSTDIYSVTPVWMLTNDADAAQIFGNTSLVMAITIPRSYAGVLQTCDVYFNGFAHQWSVAPTVPEDTADVETVALHEAGHCLGLGHYGPVTSVMDQVVEKGEAVRSLTQDDTIALCGRYPLVGESGSPCFADGGCQQTDLKCVAQPVTNGITTSLCTRGCSTGANTQCDLPFTCQTSSTFSGFNGACLLPGGTVTAVGRDCSMNPDCGNSVGFCQNPVPASAGHDFWVDGYCTQSCSPGQPACPAGSTCVTLDVGERCLQSCRVGLADCRLDYACAQIDSIGTTGVCVPRCYTDADCANATQFTCRTCDGLCVARQNVAGAIGDPCLQDSECGAGQVCRITSLLSSQKQCVQQCSRGCGTCPSGSTCTPAGKGELFCLRDCAGPGTCGPALRCADTQVGKSCLPQCNSQAECPVGQACYMGECMTPMEGDGGCNTLQCRPDAGRPIVVTPKDAGTGTGGTGGCGCSSVDSSFGFALLGLITLISRRRSWRMQ